ncbi:MAG: phosphate ABC transporter permease subunit PstC, partial [Pseudomonadota bacterium]
MTDPTPFYILVILIALMWGSYRLIYARADRLVSETDHHFGWPAAQPRHHARLCAVLCGLAGILIYILGINLRGNEPTPLWDGVWILTLVAGVSAVTALSVMNVKPFFAARARVEQLAETGLMLFSLAALLTTLGIIGSLVFEASLFFRDVSVFEFLFGTQWSPQTAIRAGGTGQSGAFGSVAVFSGTFLIALIAMCVAAPVGLMVAIYLSEYASKRLRAFAKPAIEVLAGIPTVVYGFFALITV